MKIEMVEGAEIKGSRGSRRGTSGGSSRKQGFRVMAFFLLAIYCMAGATADVYLSRQRADPVSRQELTYEANVISGDIPSKTREQGQKELDGVAEEGMLAMSMSVIPFGKISGAGHSVSWTIENPSNQGKLIHVEITRGDTGERIFKAGAIRPGSYLESGPLLTPPPARKYNCIAVFPAYQEETEALTEQAAIEIKLVLQE